MAASIILRTPPRPHQPCLGLAMGHWAGYSSFFFFFCFLGLHPRHMEIPRLGVESELQFPAYTTDVATQDPSRICNLHHSSWHRQILNPLNNARDQTRIVTDTSQVGNPLSHKGNSLSLFVLIF